MDTSLKGIRQMESGRKVTPVSSQTYPGILAEIRSNRPNLFSSKSGLKAANSWRLWKPDYLPFDK